MAKEAIIKLEDVHFKYSTKEILSGINFTVQPGEIIGYIGANGAGKSTTIKLLLSLVKGYLGQITIFGQDLKILDDTYKKRIGYVPENAEMYDQLTPQEYLAFIGGMYGLREAEIAEKTRGLLEIFKMEDVLHQKLEGFSKGMRQKILIISALMHNPDIIFLDEPLNGLDANSVSVMKEVLDQLKNHGKTIFYSSHIMDVVEKISDRIVLISDGHVVADGTMADLAKENDQGSLEAVFNQITGYQTSKTEAADFVSIILGETAL